jgi:hypothetical protein
MENRKECPEGQRASRGRARSSWIIDHADDSSLTRPASSSATSELLGEFCLRPLAEELRSSDVTRWYGASGRYLYKVAEFALDRYERAG